MEPVEAGNLPVKVTAHSRPGVVSNIIAKLISERGSAVLITAGGKAMHVAMCAVVSARTRLRAHGIDILLLPKFVTVDTTSTLGWESVFLRFK
jgi:stage V sporulation protein SpoVS